MHTKGKFTLGPWKVVKETAIDYRPNYIMSANGDSTIALVADGGPNKAIMGPEANANAALMASAPELYDALNDFLKWAEPLIGMNAPANIARNTIMDKARAAITAATKEQAG